MKAAFCILLASQLTVSVAQTPTTPPMKMGLWERTVEVKAPASDAPQSAEKPAARSPVVVRSCFTPSTWQSSFRPGPELTDCTRANETWTAQKYSVDYTCKKDTWTEHFERVFESSEKGEEVMKVAITVGNGKIVRLDSRDCAAICRGGLRHCETGWSDGAALRRRPWVPCHLANTGILLGGPYIPGLENG